jgi:hypothetical protein
MSEKNAPNRAAAGSRPGRAEWSSDSDTVERRDRDRAESGATAGEDPGQPSDKPEAPGQTREGNHR